MLIQSKNGQMRAFSVRLASPLPLPCKVGKNCEKINAQLMHGQVSLWGLVGILLMFTQTHKTYVVKTTYYVVTKLSSGYKIVLVLAFICFIQSFICYNFPTSNYDASLSPTLSHLFPQFKGLSSSGNRIYVEKWAK